MNNAVSYLALPAHDTGSDKGPIYSDVHGAPVRFTFGCAPSISDGDMDWIIDLDHGSPDLDSDYQAIVYGQTIRNVRHGGMTNTFHGEVSFARPWQRGVVDLKVEAYHDDEGRIVWHVVGEA